MTDEQILEIAYSSEHICIFDDTDDKSIIKFARAIAAQEREACAKICDDYSLSFLLGASPQCDCDDSAANCSEAIRARSE